jgi:hypothetical protein
MLNPSDDEGLVMTWLPTTVPVSVLMSAAMPTADGLSGDRPDITSWPLTIAAAAGTCASGTWTSLDGPPVITGTPRRFCQVELPPWSEAKTAYEPVDLMAEAS